MSQPTITTPRRESGVAGQFAIRTTVTYGDEPAKPYSFIGSEFGGPIIAVLPGNVQVLVDSPWRFGEKLSPAWVEAFFAAS